MIPVAPNKPRPRGGVLAVIALLMLGSAAIRVGLEAGPALARGVDPDQMDPKPEAPASTTAAELQLLLSELQAREKDLKLREEEIQNTERALEIANDAIETRLVTLEQAEEALRETLSLADKAAEKDLSRLTEVYQNMKPKDAAALFETMDPVFAAGFLGRMPADTAAGVMAGLSPEAAYTISVVMAGRNARAPQE
ncbi:MULTISPECIES: MotE family protein [unclassified Ruegeria]|uniref:MotE family protein n=1 Tax=unclassified Ruegeria TaxID=2625375 RepID=UPI001489B012|nr:MULTISPECIES: hypothetical protein [unclassified Ruegeria]